MKFGKMLVCNLTAAALTAAFIPNVNARGWDLGERPEEAANHIDVLLMTGNYETPRRLANIAQHQTGAPLIILPAAGAADDTIYLSIPDGKPPVAIPPDDLSRYISHINPKQIIIIGGPEFVKRGYRAAIEEKFPVQEIKSESWSINALQLANMLGKPRIEKVFNAHREKPKTAKPVSAVKEKPGQPVVKVNSEKPAPAPKPAAKPEVKPATAPELVPVKVQ